jgi:ribonuclease R
MKHEFEIPTRDELIALIKSNPGLTRPQIINLAVESEEQMDGVDRRLFAMFRDGQITTDNDKVYIQENVKTGLLKKTNSGTGFVNFDDGTAPWFLTRDAAKFCIDGEVVEVSPHDENQKGILGRVTKIVKSTKSHVAKLKVDSDGEVYLLGESEQKTLKLILPKDFPKISNDAEWFFISLLPSQSKRERILKSAEKIDTPSALQEIRLNALSKHDFPAINSKEAIDEALYRASEYQFPAVDYTMLPLVTIDGVGARDLDDAIYAKELEDKSWHVFVAIADVSRYVLPGTKLDEDARNKGTSVYVPGCVFPMLPAILSNEICSLQPNVKRHALMFEALLDDAGNVLKYQFFEAQISSHMRYSYQRTQELIDGDVPSSVETETLPVVLSANKLKSLLTQKRTERGALEFEREEHGVSLNNDDVDGFFVKKSYETNRLIEEFMILANVCAAQFVEKHFGYGLFRHHSGLKEESVADLNDFLCTFNVDINLTRDSSAKMCAEASWQLPEGVQNEFDALLRKSLNHAVYSAEETGHFGLSLPEYAHFTSPIRRYPDLVKHRMIKHVLSEQGFDVTGAYNYSLEELVDIAEHCSERSYKASLVERDVMDSLSAIWWLNNENKDIVGTLSGTYQSMGFFKLANTPSQAACSLSLLNEDIQLGDKVLLTITNVDTQNGKISATPKVDEAPF